MYMIYSYVVIVSSFIVPDPVSLVTYITVTVSGSTAIICVDTEGAATIKLILRDARDQRYIRDCEIQNQSSPPHKTAPLPPQNKPKSYDH